MSKQTDEQRKRDKLTADLWREQANKRTTPDWQRKTSRAIAEHLERRNRTSSY